MKVLPLQHVCARRSFHLCLGFSAFLSNFVDMKSKSATLYLLPVPLSDDVSPAEVMPPHNMEIARGVKHFIVENVRSARRFLKRCDPDTDIDALTFSVLDEHTDPGEVEAMLTPLFDGCDMAVVSEAGCPAVADPGALAVACAQRHGCRVVPLVGPSSILLSLMASGFNGQQWRFCGYLPVESGARADTLRQLERESRRSGCTQIFIETPYRNVRLLEQLCRVLNPETMLCVASDISGKHECITTRPVGQWRNADADLAKRPAIFLINASR